MSKDGVLYVPRMSLDDLALIGNCQFSALVERDGAIVWCCLPRFDSEPVFAALLDDERRTVHDRARRRRHGRAALPGQHQRARDALRDRSGAFRVIDFAPRFLQYDRIFRPTQLVRIVEPLRGTPRIAVRCDPRLGWSKAAPHRDAGLEPRPLRGLREPAAAHHRRAALLPRRAAVRAHRAAALRADLGRARRRAAGAAVRPLPRARPCATGSAG